MPCNDVVEALSLAKNNTDRQAPVITDIESLEHGIEEVLEMVERVSGYVDQITQVRRSTLYFKNLRHVIYTNHL